MNVPGQSEVFQKLRCQVSVPGTPGPSRLRLIVRLSLDPHRSLLEREAVACADLTQLVLEIILIDVGSHKNLVKLNP